MKVLFLEDDLETAEYLQSVLRGEGWGVDHRSTLLQASHACQKTDFNLMILDRLVPDGDSLNWLSARRQMQDKTPAIVLTALGRSTDKTSGYDAGADDYLSKPFEVVELLARIRALMRRVGYANHDMLTLGDIELRVKARTVFVGSEHIVMSRKEFDLLHYMMDNSGEIVTREMLLKKVWGLTFDPGTNVIDVNVGRLRKKLQIAKDSIALETIRGVGFRLEERH